MGTSLWYTASASTSMTNMMAASREKVHTVPWLEYSHMTKTGPDIRDRLPMDVSKPMEIPCLAGSVIFEKRELAIVKAIG